VKRSKCIRLVLLGGLSAGALAGCNQSEPTAVGTDSVYTNNYFVQGVGYYHAPFRAWYIHPYNYYDAQQKRYFFGGQWGQAPHQSITNISPPTSEAVRQAQAQRSDLRRGGFGSTSRSHFIYG